MLRTFHIGPIHVTESDEPDTVLIRIQTAEVRLTKEEFNELCSLNQTSLYGSNSIKWAELPVQPELPLPPQPHFQETSNQ